MTPTLPKLPFGFQSPDDDWLCQIAGSSNRAHCIADIEEYGRACYAQALTWQPIETAPKDGAWILLWRRHATKPFIGRWDSSYAEFEDTDSVHVYHLTNWMPLPSPPEKEPR